MLVRFAARTALGPCLALLVSAQTPGTGRVHIKPIRTYSGAALARPTAIVVYDFAVTPEEVKLNSGALSRVRTRVSGNEAGQKSELAQKIGNDFSRSLIEQLSKTGLPVSHGTLGEAPPDNAIAIQGDFSEIDEGNRARRMGIGLGAGASKVEAHVECYLKGAAEKITLTEFKATSESSRKPGAAETMGAGAAPEAAATVSGATELKQGAEGDTDRMAKAVAKQIKKVFASQGWTKESL
jgi:hypothetical protein